MARPSRQRERADSQASTQETENEEETEGETCPECDASLVASADGGELVCEDCGLVVEEGTIDRGPEWRAFDHNERQEKSRV
ncbi:transcription initiation factor IIB 3, partial [Halapricum sp. CBA1109]|uniref:TFIIB-type zinc ribbon-containing protein n=1 Tax=Halapricum sp. CBA1109 TaxID=2668068 RepID=UPI0013B99C7A